MKHYSLLLICNLLILTLISGFIPKSKAQILVKMDEFKFIKQDSYSRLLQKANQEGKVVIIVGLKINFIPEGNLNKNETERQRLAIKQSQSSFLENFKNSNIKNVKRFDYIPYLAFQTDSNTLQEIKRSEMVSNIQEDEIAEPALAESIPMVSANLAWASGYTGNGQTVAILDSGVDKNHSFLSGRVISEACYSSNISGSSTSVCPGAVTDSTASDSGLNCPTTVDGCAHGTNVAGIAAGRGATISGVAKDANIIAIQIFSKFDTSANCGTVFPCARYWTSDLIKGLERVRTLANTMPNIVAVNLSLQTGQQFTSNCDTSHAATKAAIDNLRSVNIATIVCAGNYSFTNALTAPACISTAISVGSVDDGSSGTTQGVVSSFSDSSPLLHLLAPGRWINSSIPGNLFQNYSGTSMATPHVVGAFAILKQKTPNSTINQMLNALTVTGSPIIDSRNGIIKPLINVNNALKIIGNKNFDYDGDSKSDISVFRPSDGGWYMQNSTTGFYAVAFGQAGDKVVPADFSGDGKTDVAVWRSGTWYVFDTSNNTFYGIPFGTTGDIPVPEDFDGDGKADINVFRPSSGMWFRNNSSNGQFVATPFGQNGDVPTVGDFDGDGKADIAVFRQTDGGWYRLNSSNGSFFAVAFGQTGDKVVPADYTGDGKTDIAVYRGGTWYILRSEDLSFYGIPFGLATDIPTAGDFDGDGKADQAVYRNGQWFIQQSTSGFLSMPFGLSTDTPTPSSYTY